MALVQPQVLLVLWRDSAMVILSDFTIDISERVLSTDIRDIYLYTGILHHLSTWRRMATLGVSMLNPYPLYFPHTLTALACRCSSFQIPCSPELPTFLRPFSLL